MTLKTRTIVAEKVPIEQVWVRISTHHLTELRGSRFGHRTFPKPTNPACSPLAAHRHSLPAVWQ